MKKIIALFLSIALVTGYAWSAPAYAAPAGSLELYVSTTGDGDGMTPETAFPSIEAARDYIRSVKTAVTVPINVNIMGGDYYIGKTIEFLPEDSGTPECPITYRAYNNEEVVISGGEVIDGQWEPLSALNADEIPASLAGREDGIYYLDIPGAVGGNWKFRTLYADGKRQIAARYPNYTPEAEYEGTSFLYESPDAAVIYVGLAKSGDYMEYAINAPKAGTYDVVLGYVTTVEDIHNYLDIEIDGQKIANIPAMQSCPSWRYIRYAVVGSYDFTAGVHILKIANTAGLDEGEMRVHLDALLITDNPGFINGISYVESTVSGVVYRSAKFPAPAEGETRVIVQAEDASARLNEYTSIGNQTIVITTNTATNTAINADPSQIKASWADDPAAVIDAVTTLHYWNEMLYIKSIDPVTGRIDLYADSEAQGSGEAKGVIQAGNYFFIKHVLEELDAENEWYLDYSSGRLFYMPKAGQDPNAMEFIAPVTGLLVHLNGDDGSDTGGSGRVQYLNFSSLTFKHAADTIGRVEMRTPTDGAFKLTMACNNTIDNCVFTATEGFGVWLHLDSRENTISNCEIYDNGAGGVILTTPVIGYGGVYDSRPGVRNYAPLRNSILRNRIHDGNQVRVNGAGVLLESRPASTAMMAGNIIAYNDIYNMKRQGIFGFQNSGGNLVAYNRIANIMLESADGGAINFAEMTNLAAPTIVYNNYVDGVIGLRRTGPGLSGRGVFGGMGIYPDHSTSHVYAFNNIVRNTGYSAFFSNGGSHHLVYNNIFANDKRALYDNAEVSNDCAMQTQIFHNIFAVTDVDKAAQMIYMQGSGEFNAARQAEVGAIIRDNPQYYVNSDYNVFYSAAQNATFLPHGDFTRWQAAGQDPHSTLQDPGLLFYPDGSYTLAVDSIAYDLGFELIDLSKIGPDAPDDPDLGIGWVDVETHQYTSAIEGNSAVFTINDISQAFPFMLYTAFEKYNKLDAKIESAYGTTYFRVSDVLSEYINSAWQTHLGTYYFEPGQTYKITFTQPDGEISKLPKDMTLIAKSAFAADKATELMETVVTMDKDTEMAVGDSAVVTAHAVLGNGFRASFDSLRYESDNARVSVDDNGHITVLGEGEAKITAVGTRNGVSVRSKPITIKAGTYLRKVILKGPEGLMDVGETVWLALVGLMSDGAEHPLEDADIAYSASPEGIVNIDETGLMLALAEGAATVSATAWIDGEGYVSNEITVIVGKPVLLVHYTFDEEPSGNQPANDYGAAPAGAGSFNVNAERAADTPGGVSQASLYTRKDGALSYFMGDVNAVNKVAGLGKYTISFWYKDLREVVPLYDRLFSMSTNGFDIQSPVDSPADNARFRFLLDGGSNTIDFAVNASEWAFIAFTYDGNTVSIYIGSESGEATLIGTSVRPNLIIKGDTFIIGGINGNNTRVPEALFDDFRVYDGAMPLYEVERIRLDNLSLGIASAAQINIPADDGYLTAIDNTPPVNKDVLFATLEEPNTDGPLHYIWETVDLADPLNPVVTTVGEDSPEYIVTADDIGKLIRVTIFADDRSGILTSEPTVEVLQLYHTVGFHANGETVEALVADDEPVAEPEAPVLHGYVFAGWRLGSPDGGIYDFSSPVTMDIDLYAAWNPNIVINEFEIEPGNKQATIPFAIYSANGKGYTVYLSETGAEDSFIPYDDVNFNSKGAHIKGLTNGVTYYTYITYTNAGGEIETSNIIAFTPGK